MLVFRGVFPAIYRGPHVTSFKTIGLGPTLQQCHTENNANAFGWAGSGIPECLVVGTSNCVLLQRNVGDGDKIQRMIIYVYLYMYIYAIFRWPARKSKLLGIKCQHTICHTSRVFPSINLLLASVEKL